MEDNPPPPRGHLSQVFREQDIQGALEVIAHSWRANLVSLPPESGYMFPDGSSADTSFLGQRLSGDRTTLAERAQYCLPHVLHSSGQR